MAACKGKGRTATEKVRERTQRAGEDNTFMCKGLGIRNGSNSPPNEAKRRGLACMMGEKGSTENLRNEANFTMNVMVLEISSYIVKQAPGRVT